MVVDKVTTKKPTEYFTFPREVSLSLCEPSCDKLAKRQEKSLTFTHQHTQVSKSSTDFFPLKLAELRSIQHLITK